MIESDSDLDAVMLALDEERNRFMSACMQRISMGD